MTDTRAYLNEGRILLAEARLAELDGNRGHLSTRALLGLCLGTGCFALGLLVGILWR